MASQRSSFSKLQRERDKQAKATAKREKRQDRSKGGDEEVETELDVVGDGSEISPGELLKMVETLHRDFDDKKIDLETFEEKKTELLSRIRVD